MSDLKTLLASCIGHEKNEATAYPYWIIIDPARVPLCNYDTRVHYISSAITGPFFSRAKADDHLIRASHHYSEHAKVFCASGYNSEDWCDLLKMAAKEDD